MGLRFDSVSIANWNFLSFTKDAVARTIGIFIEKHYAKATMVEDISIDFAFLRPQRPVNTNF